MPETHFEKIEQYFSGEMNNEDQQLFETALATDEELALTFRMYKSIEADMRNNHNYGKKDAALRGTLKGLNKSYFEQSGLSNNEKSVSRLESSQENFHNEQNVAAKQGTGRSKIISLVAKLAAASVILILGWYFLFNPPSANSLADRYISEHLQAMSPSLGSNRDSLEMGKEAFNKKDYAEAEKIFSSLQRDKVLNSEAIEYLGIVYLNAGKYGQAINQFDLLSGDTSLHTNLGPFYKAITLIKRNDPGDHEAARVILANIIKNDLPGRKESEQLIKRMD